MLIKQNPCRLLLRVGLFLSFMVLNSPLVIGATPEIIDVPTVLNSSYDLIWTISPTPNKRIAFSIFVETPVKGAGGYRLTLTSRQASWQSLSRPAAFPSINSPISLAERAGYHLDVETSRRYTVALLCNHRLVFSAPAPTNVGGLLRLAPVVSGVRVSDMHYQPVETPRFGDDFMRSGGIERMLTGLDCWQEDDCWQVASYQGVAFPGEKEAFLLNGKTNPWQLSLFPNTQTTTNGFWLLYSGVGPSWVVSHPMLSSPSWDRY